MERCSLCGRPIGIGQMVIGVQRGGQFHPECWDRTLPTVPRIRSKVAVLWWRARGRPTRPVFLGR